MRIAAKTPPRRWPVLGNVLAGLSVLLATLAGGGLFFAYISSGGNDAVPEGPGELTVWFALPGLAVFATIIAIRQAIHAADHGGGLMWAAIADGVAVAALAAWWLYAGTLID